MARWVIDFFVGDGTFDKLAPRMRDHIVATTPTHYLDMQSGFDPPLSAHADLHLPMLVLRGERTHPALARSAAMQRRAERIAGHGLRREPFADRHAC